MCPSNLREIRYGAVLNELVLPAVRDGGAFTSVRGFLGTPQRGIRFSKTFVMNHDGEFDKLDRLRQQVENGTLTLRLARNVSQKTGGSRPKTA
jgi:NADPH2:quinone reductase